MEVDYWNLSDEPGVPTDPRTSTSPTRKAPPVHRATRNHLPKRPRWQGRSLVHARCRIPGNFLAEGGVFVLGGVSSYEPPVVHAHRERRGSVPCHGSERGRRVRGEWAGDFPGVVRPMLEWEEWEDGAQVGTDSGGRVG